MALYKEIKNILALRKMGIKTILTVYLTPLKMAIIKKTGMVDIGKDTKKRRSLTTIDGTLN